ncbi:hypothetical protein N656DRAFT_783152 [Canariomyces notabilis]|uniref:Uncharacterized protein n=1 Tax=Canariomyces notabilis TaxID=2074819 RepID=A0AAN6T8L9_9PEZI|nr:hypothetical protein N656DRAFT_783152 [Canariomyces arenarius]
MASQPDARVLEEILKTLQRLETCLDGRTNVNTLGTTDVSSISTSTHATSSWRDRSSRRPSHSSSSSQGPGHHDQLGSPITPSYSYDAQSAVSAYKASIAELRKRFEFIDDGSSGIIGDTPDATSNTNVQPAVGLGLYENEQGAASDDEYEYDMVYTESAYSQFPSRLDLGNSGEKELPPLPDSAQLRDYSLAGTASRFKTEDQQQKPGTLDAQSRQEPPHAQDGPSQVRQGTPLHQSVQGFRYDEQPDSGAASNPSASRQHEWKSVIRRRHDRVEMAYFAWNRFKASLCSSWWFISQDRKANKCERRRLRNALTPDAAVLRLETTSTTEGTMVSRLTRSIARRLKVGKMESWLRGSVDKVA